MTLSSRLAPYRIVRLLLLADEEEEEKEEAVVQGCSCSCTDRHSREDKDEKEGDAMSALTPPPKLGMKRCFIELFTPLCDLAVVVRVEKDL